jgi:hypothetical protein
MIGGQVTFNRSALPSQGWWSRNDRAKDAEHLPFCGADLESPSPEVSPTLPFPSYALGRQPIIPDSGCEATGRNGRKNIGSETVGLVTSLPSPGKPPTSLF